MTFYLQFGVPRNYQGWPESRTFLDDHLHDGCELIRAVPAKDWKEARSLLTDVEALA